MLVDLFALKISQNLSRADQTDFDEACYHQVLAELSSSVRSILLNFLSHLETEIKGLEFSLLPLLQFILSTSLSLLFQPEIQKI